LKKTSFLLIIVLALIFSGCQSAQKDGFAIYLLAQDLPASALSQNDLGKLVLESEPILSSADIISYDKTNHIIELTRAAHTRIQKVFPLPVKVNGFPFVVCVGKERIYAGAFWTPLSSLSFDGVVIMQSFDANETSIQLSLGYPGPGFHSGKDPRSDARILNALQQEKKLK
jgi:hypothetical protein